MVFFINKKEFINESMIDVVLWLAATTRIAGF